MQNKAFYLTGICILVSLSSLSQNLPVISFEEKEFNFGTIKETDPVVSHEFRFTNEGKVPLIINDVKSSCGCTVPEWPREPVLPGKSSTIKVNFNPKQQKGSVVKSIQILSNAVKPQIPLIIKGVVIPAENVEDVYKFNAGPLKLQTIYAAFGEVYKGKKANYTIRVLNFSDAEKAAITFPNLPKHLTVRITPEVLRPREEGIIEITYNTAEINSWDYMVDRLPFLVNGKSVSNTRISITANIKEDFSGLTAEQLAMSAHAEFDNRQFDFGNIPDDKPVEHSFKLTNTGKSNLIIRKISASCGCTAVQPAKTTILPGESTVIKAIYNPKGSKAGNQKKAITVITNDPKNSRSVLWVSATIVRADASN